MRLFAYILSASRRFVARSSRVSLSTINIDKSVELGSVIPDTSINDISHSELIGNRKYQEDRCRVVKLDTNIIFAGIFDGHGGSLAVDFASKELPVLLEYRLKHSSKETDLAELLKCAFCDVNQMLLDHIKKTKPHKERYSGTTATVSLLIDNTHLHTASVGDSRAILCRNRRAVPLTDDHSPDKPEERDRIESNNGSIISNSLGDPLVNGRLAMTRSIGDFDLKMYGVTAEPEYVYKKVDHAKDAFVILVTDGVTFSLSNDDVVRTAASGSSTQQAAHRVVQLAIDRGSHDNSSAIVLPLRPWEILQHEEATPGLPLGTLLSSQDMRRARD